MKLRKSFVLGSIGLASFLGATLDKGQNHEPRESVIGARSQENDDVVLSNGMRIPRSRVQKIETFDREEAKKRITINNPYPEYFIPEYRGIGWFIWDDGDGKPYQAYMDGPSGRTGRKTNLTYTFE